MAYPNPIIAGKASGNISDAPCSKEARCFVTWSFVQALTSSVGIRAHKSGGKSANRSDEWSKRATAVLW